MHAIHVLVGRIASTRRHHPYDQQRLAALNAELAALHEVADRERVATLAAELPRMTPEEVRRVAAAARRNDNMRRKAGEADDPTE
jgi:hypothetical protein